MEAYYSRLSLDLALESVDASRDLFMGYAEGSSTNGLGLDDYMSAVGADKGGTPLLQLIEDQYDLAVFGLEALKPNSLYDAIINDFEATKTAYAHAQNQVVHLKTDLPAELCVSINYVEAIDDGD